MSEMCQFSKDRRKDPLENWITWIEEWKRVQIKLCRTLARVPEHLLMNHSEEINRIREEKLLITYATIPSHFDKYRGKPDFWKLPAALSSRACDDAKYFAVLTKEEQYIVPTVECVGLSNYIKKEKNILELTRTQYRKWQKSEYRKTQIERLSLRMKTILPHWPDFSELIVLGTKLQQASGKKFMPTAFESEEDVAQADELFPEKPPKSEATFSINDIIFSINGSPHEGSKIRLNFELDLSSTHQTTNFLYFRNTSSVTIRIAFTKLENFRLFESYPRPKDGNFSFFFYTKEVIVLPGKRVQIPILFRAKSSGVFSENWELKSAPRLWDDSFHVVLILHGYSFYQNLKTFVDNTVRYIEARARDILISNIIDEVIEGTKYSETTVMPIIYEEKHAFEKVNERNKLPLYLYDKNVVDELKKFYNKLDQSGSTWNYSVTDLQKLAHRKDIQDYNQAPLAYIYTHQEECESLTRNLDRPLILNRDRQKYFACTKIFSAYFTRMCCLLESLGCSEKTVTYPPFPHHLVPMQNQPKRLIWEYFEDNVFKSRADDFELVEGKRKPKSLLNIPEDDLEAIYKSYFGDEKEKRQAGKSKNKKSDTKIAKTKKKKKAVVKAPSSKVLKPQTSVPEEDLNPVERFEYVVEVDRPVVVTQRTGNGEVYNYKQYLLFYCCLCSAIDALVDTIESQW